MARWRAGPHGSTLTATGPAALALLRTGAGAVMLVSPQVLPRVLGVDAAARARTAWVVQMLGVREVALGAGALAAQRSAGVRACTAAGTAGDLVDALVVGAAVRRGVVTRSWGSAVAASALAAAAAGLVHLVAGRR